MKKPTETTTQRQEIKEHNNNKRIVKTESMPENNPVHQKDQSKFMKAMRRFWIAVAVAILLIAGALGSYWKMKQSDREMREDLLQQAQMIEQAMNLDLVRMITGSNMNRNAEVYNRVREQLSVIRQTNQNCRFLYLMGRNAGGKVFFYLDTDENKPAKPGEIYPDASDKLRNIFDSGNPFVEGPLPDAWGTWVSALVPLMDPLTGERIAVLGMDMDASTWKWDVARTALPILLLPLSLIVILLISANLLKRRSKLTGTSQFRMWQLEPAIVIAVGLTITSFVSQYAYQRVSSERAESFKTLALSKTANLSNDIFDFRDIELEGLANYFNGSEKVTSDEFREFTKYLTRIQVVQDWGWIPAVSANDKVTFEGVARSEGITGFEIWQNDKQGKREKASGRTMYFPKLRVAPLKGNEGEIGYDFGSETSGRSAIEMAIRTGLTSGSEPENLSQGKGSQKVLLIFKPLYYNKKPGDLKGFVFARLKLETLLKTSAPDQMASIDLNILHNHKTPELICTSRQPGTYLNSELQLTRPVFAFGKEFTVTASAGPEFERTHPLRAGWMMALVGLLLTFILTILVTAGIRRREKLQLLISDRTSELQESEAHFRILFENSPVGKSMTRLNGISDVNKSFSNITGYSREELSTLQWYEITYPDDIPKNKELIESLLRGEIKSARFESRLIHKNRSVVWTDLSCFLQRDKNSNPEFFITTINDITERKQVEEALKESENLYRNLIERMPDGVYKSTPEGKFVKVNHAMVKMLGYESEEELLTIDIKTQLYFDPLDRESLVLSERLKGMEVYQLRKKDGSGIWVEDHGWYNVDEEGKILFHEGILRDVSGRIEAEEKLRESEARFKSYFELSLAGIAISSPTAEWIEVNNRLCEMLGYSWEELKKTTWSELTHPDDLVLDMEQFNRVLSGEIDGYTLDKRFICKNGETIWTSMSVRVVRSPDNNMNYFIGLVFDVTERKRVEKALQAEESRLRAITDSVQDAILMITPEGNISFFNHAAERIFGYSGDEILGKNLHNLLAPERYHESQQKAFSRFLLTGKGEAIGKIMEMEARCKNGREISIELSLSSLQLPDGLYGVGIIRDITERKKAEEALKESQQLFQNLTHVSPVGIFRTRIDGYTTYVNPRWSELSGLSFEEALGNGWLKAVHPDDRDRLIANWKADVSVQQKSVAEYRFLKPDGRIVWVMGNAVPETKDDIISGFIGTLTDITERKQAEVALQESERQQATLISNLPGFVYRCANDPNWTMAYMSEGCKNITGYAGKDFLNNKKLAFNDIIHPDFQAPIRQKWQKTLTEKRVFRAEYPIIKAGGEIRWVFEQGRGIFAENGELLFLEGFITDITSRKTAEEKINKLNEELEQRVKDRTSQLELANKELESFSYSVSHDLRTPLRALDGFANILLEDYAPSLDAEGKRLLNVIINNANKMGHLIDDMLSFSRLGRKEFKFSKIDMHQMANSVYEELVAEADRNRIEFRLQAIPNAFGDPAMLRQVWLNLIGNAIKFTSKKPQRIIEIGAKTSDQETTFYIKDNGAGFNMENSNKLFGVFQRLHSTKDFAGTGVGLAIVNRILERHNGHIWAEGIVNEGATFYFVLPESINK